MVLVRPEATSTTTPAAESLRVPTTATVRPGGTNTAALGTRSPISIARGSPAPVGIKSTRFGSDGVIDSAHLPSGDSSCARPCPIFTGAEPSSRLTTTL